MSAFSTYSADKILDHLLTTAAWTVPTNCYVGLFTSDAGLNDNNESAQTEVSGGAYARQDTSGTFASASGGTVTNSAGEIVFPTATTDWGIVSHFALFDAATSGNVLMWGPFSSGSREILTGDGPRFLTSSLTLNVT